jgi:hypothetical protein
LLLLLSVCLFVCFVCFICLFCFAYVYLVHHACLLSVCRSAQESAHFPSRAAGTRWITVEHG